MRIIIAILMSLSLMGGQRELPHSMLDCIEYEPPFEAFAARSFLIADRESGDEWWLLMFNGHTVVLPRGVSKQEVPR